jgi:hypothetical protein
MDVLSGLLLLAVVSAVGAYMKHREPRWFVVAVQRTASWMLGCLAGAFFAALVLLVSGGAKVAFVLAICGGVLTHWTIRADRFDQTEAEHEAERATSR